MAPNPYSLRSTIVHPLARMLPLQREQMQVYRLGEKHPPSGDVPGSGPMWEPVSFVLAARDTLQARVNLQRFFTLMALTTQSSSNVNGGFRMQFFDTKKERRFADRNVNQVNVAGPVGGGGTPGAVFLREPYVFDQPDSQILVVVQNLETVTNTIQLAFYGHVMRFNEPGPGNFPGGPMASTI
jgi:hypothetical protein